MFPIDCITFFILSVASSIHSVLSASIYVLCILFLPLCLYHRFTNPPPPPPPPCQPSIPSVLYVVSYVERTICVYRIDPATKGAQLQQTVQLYGMGDNLHLSQSRDALLVATHPDYFRYWKYMHSPTPWDHISPSSVSKQVELAYEEECAINPQISQFYPPLLSI